MLDRGRPILGSKKCYRCGNKEPKLGYKNSYTPSIKASDLIVEPKVDCFKAGCHKR